MGFNGAWQKVAMRHRSQYKIAYFKNIYKIIGEELAFETFYSSSWDYYKRAKKLSSSWGAKTFWSHDHATALWRTQIFARAITPEIFKL